MSEVILSPGKPIKLVIWDLDDALWTGADGTAPAAPAAPAALRHRDARAVIAALDDRGILQSAVARSGAAAWRGLEQRGLADYLLCPRLTAGDRPAAVRDIARELDLALDATLIVGAEVAGGQGDEGTRGCPEICAVASTAIPSLLEDPRIGPSLVGLEPRPRRLIYREELARAAAERAFLASAGPGGQAAFIATLGMRLAFTRAVAGDLPRLRELVNRANQRCAIYGDGELARLCSSPDPACLMISLCDRFGDSGQVGALVLERAPARWTVQLLQLSCRAQRRGVPELVIGWILRQARAAGVGLVTEVVPTSKTQALCAMYQRAGFTEIERRGDVIALVADPAAAPAAPSWLTLIAPPAGAGAPLAC